MPIERTIWCVISTELQLDFGTLHYWDIGTCRNHSFELTTRSESFRLGERENLFPRGNGSRANGLF